MCSETNSQTSICGAIYLNLVEGIHQVAESLNLHNLVFNGSFLIHLHSDSESFNDNNPITKELIRFNNAQPTYIYPTCGLEPRSSESNHNRTLYCHPDKCILLLSPALSPAVTQSHDCCCKQSGCNRRLYVLNKDTINDTSSVASRWLVEDANRLGVSRMLMIVVCRINVKCP